jgi:hypothetical protein
VVLLGIQQALALAVLVVIQAMVVMGAAFKLLALQAVEVAVEVAVLVLSIIQLLTILMAVVVAAALGF